MILLLLPFIPLFLTIPLANIFFQNIAKSYPDKLYSQIYKNREVYYTPILATIESFYVSCQISPNLANPTLANYLRNNNLPIFTCNDLLQNKKQVEEQVIKTLVDRDFSAFLSAYNTALNKLNTILSRLNYTGIIAVLLIAIYVYKVINDYQDYRFLLFLIPAFLISLGTSFIFLSEVLLKTTRTLLTVILNRMFSAFFNLSFVNSDINFYLILGIVLTILGVASAIALYYWLKYIEYAF